MSLPSPSTLLATVTLAFASVFTAGAALAQDWKHASVKSAEGVTLNLDYTTKKDPVTGCYKCTLYTRTDALWLNIEAPGLGDGDTVRAVVLNKRYTQWTRPEPTEIETYAFDLAPAGNGRFTVDAGTLRTWGQGYGGVEDFVLEIALVVNGKWLQDPISGTSNFQLNLAQD